MRASESRTHSAARRTSPACSDRALTLGMRRRSNSSSWNAAVVFGEIAIEIGSHWDAGIGNGIGKPAWTPSEDRCAASREVPGTLTMTNRGRENQHALLSAPTAPTPRIVLRPSSSDLRAMLRLALPVAAVQLGLMAMGVVDTIMVGHVSPVGARVRRARQSLLLHRGHLRAGHAHGARSGHLAGRRRA